MIEKLRNGALALSALILLFISTSVQAEEVLSRKNNVGVSYGLYSLQTKSKAISSVGLIQLQFRRALNESLSFEGAYLNGASISGGFSSLFWGFDLGGSYVIGHGFPSTKKVSDVLTIFENKKFGIFVGGGFSVRALPLQASTITYSGTYIQAQPQYYITENVEVHARAQYSMLVNGGTSLSTATVIFGIGMSF